MSNSIDAIALQNWLIAHGHSPEVTTVTSSTEGYAAISANWRGTMPCPAELALLQHVAKSLPAPVNAYNAILVPGSAAFSLFQRVRAVAKRDPAVQLAYGDFRGALQANIYNSGALSGALANLHTDLSAATPATLGVTLNAALRAELMQGNSNAGFTTAEKSTIAAWTIMFHLGVVLPWA